MAITAAMRKTRRRAKPCSFWRRVDLGRGPFTAETRRVQRKRREEEGEEESELRSDWQAEACPTTEEEGCFQEGDLGCWATGVLRDFYGLFAFDIGVFDDDRVGVDAHDFVALFHGHALGGEEDIFAIQEERGLLAIDALGGKTIILHRNRRRGHHRRRTGRGRRRGKRARVE